jgi:hypothetical protein
MKNRKYGSSYSCNIYTNNKMMPKLSNVDFNSCTTLSWNVFSWRWSFRGWKHAEIDLYYELIDIQPINKVCLMVFFIYKCSKTPQPLLSHFVFPMNLYLLYGPSHMPIRRMFLGPYTTFRWSSQKHKNRGLLYNINNMDKKFLWIIWHVKYTCQALAVWLVSSPFPHCASAPLMWYTVGFLFFHHPLDLLLWPLLDSASQCTGLVQAAHDYGSLSLQPTDPADAATVPWLLAVVWNCITSWYYYGYTVYLHLFTYIYFNS